MMSEKEIPSSLEESTEIDDYVFKLWRWSKRLKISGLIGFCIVLFIGFIIAYINSGSTKEVTTMSHHTYTERVFDGDLFHRIYTPWIYYGAIVLYFFNMLAWGSRYIASEHQKKCEVALFEKNKMATNEEVENKLDLAE